MSDITLESLGAKVDALDTSVDALGTRLDNKIDGGFAKAFEQTQGGFEEYGRFATFLDVRLRKEMTQRFNQVDRRFDGMEGRFDRLEKRFDGLEKLIKGRPVSSKRPRPGR